MRFENVKFITSVAGCDKIYDSNMPEIAVAGKSNVGKSSFINMLCDNRKMAKTSSQPGRTRLINYFQFGEKFMLVDLPGYGYAEVAKTEKEKWGVLIEGYLQNSTNLKRVILLLDSRHLPTNDDLIMINYLHHYAIPFTIVLTKIDKMSKNQLQKSKRDILTKIKMTENDIFAVSSVTKQGADNVIEFISKIVQ